MKLTVSGPSQAPAQLGAQALPAGHHVTAMARPPKSVTTSHPGLPPHAAPPHCPAPPPNSLRRVKLDLPGAVTVTGYLLAVIYAVIKKSLPRPSPACCSRAPERGVRTGRADRGRSTGKG